MAKRQEPEIVHPLKALDALGGFHSDVSLLMMAVQNAASMMSRKDLDQAAIIHAALPGLTEALEKVRRWHTQ